MKVSLPWGHLPSLSAITARAQLYHLARQMSQEDLNLHMKERYFEAKCSEMSPFSFRVPRQQARVLQQAIAKQASRPNQACIGYVAQTIVCFERLLANSHLNIVLFNFRALRCLRISPPSLRAKGPGTNRYI